MGSVTGIVGATGGLGGFVPPLVMGAVYSAKSSYSIGYMLLSDLALAGCVYAYTRMRTAGTPRTRPTPGPPDRTTHHDPRRRPPLSPSRNRKGIPPRINAKTPPQRFRW
ncbi:hypothetical protein ACFQ3Z_31140 [Streptomyces nogalater]